MTLNLQNIYSTKSLRAALTEHQLKTQDSVFCTKDNLKESLSIVLEELESLGITELGMDENQNESCSIKHLIDTYVKIINATWKLIHKHRSLMRLQEQLKDSHHKVINDNTNLKNHVARLKEDLQKTEEILCQTQDREKRLRVEFDNVSRDLKREKDETQKLKKQSLSKDNQHRHEIRRISQSGCKLREQLQRSIGTYVPRDKASQQMQADQEKKIAAYQSTIRRLEENNARMLQQINELKETLELHETGIELQIEASGIWPDADIETV